MDSISKKLGLIIKKLREENNLSQDELAFKAGLHRNYISLLERGLRNITFVKLLTILKIFKIKPYEFFDNYKKEF